MRLGTRRRRSKNRLLPLFVLTLILLSYVSYFFIRNLEKTFSEVAVVKAEIVATEAINQVVFDKIASKINYSDLVEIDKDSQGKIVMMRTNTAEVSKIVAETTLIVQQKLKETGEERISIPLMQGTESRIFAAVGPNIRASFVPIGTTHVDIKHMFSDAGINQTLHQIYLQVEAEMNVIVPLLDKKVTVNTEVPLVETIIVGDVPGTYLGVNL